MLSLRVLLFMPTMRSVIYGKAILSKIGMILLRLGLILSSQTKPGHPTTQNGKAMDYTTKGHAFLHMVKP